MNSTLEIGKVIDIDDKGVARVAGTRMKVVQIALEYTRLGQTPEQIVGSHLQLSLPQVEAALEYYQSHQAAIEAQIRASLVYADQARQEAGTGDLAARLNAAKQQEERQSV